MKSMEPLSEAIFFITYFHRAGGRGHGSANEHLPSQRSTNITVRMVCSSNPPAGAIVTARNDNDKKAVSATLPCCLCKKVQ